MGAITDARAGVAAALDTITGLRAYSYPPDSPALPAAIVTGPTVTYGLGFDDLGETISFDVIILVNRANPRSGEATLDDLVLSVPAALRTDRTFGGVIDDCRLDSYRPLGAEEVAAYQAFGGVFTLHAMLS